MVFFVKGAFAELARPLEWKRGFYICTTRHGVEPCKIKTACTVIHDGKKGVRRIIVLEVFYPIGQPRIMEVKRCRRVVKHVSRGGIDGIEAGGLEVGSVRLKKIALMIFIIGRGQWYGGRRDPRDEGIAADAQRRIVQRRQTSLLSPGAGDKGKEYKHQGHSSDHNKQSSKPPKN